MKNSSKLLALGLVLFLGSCSALKEEYLDKVKGKTMYNNIAQTGADIIGTFNSDGKEITTGSELYEFIETEDGSTGKYEYEPAGFLPYIFTIKTSDGKTGTLVKSGLAGTGNAPQDVWFK